MQTIQKAERAVAGGFAGAASNGLEERTTTNATTPSPSPAITATNPEEQRGQKVRAMLRARLGDDIFTSWFNALDFESFEAGTVKFSVPVKFLRTWIQSHYSEDLLACCRAEFKGAEKVEVVLRQPGNSASARAEAEAAAAAEPTNGARNGAQVESG
ncbi:DnaA N-terminal domain-containing protein, partial [Hyphomicrobium sp.]